MFIAARKRRQNTCSRGEESLRNCTFVSNTPRVRLYRDSRMSKLFDQIAETLLPGMTIPDPLRRLFEWIESNGYYIDTDAGQRIGFLFPEDKLKKGRTKTE